MGQPYRTVILEALQKVILEPGYEGVVENRNIHEQALAHRLAVHLENSRDFDGFIIDCEYDRHGEEKKNDMDGRHFRPDIVVHVRGTDEHNLLMIETKKFNDPPFELEAAKQALRDRSKAYQYSQAFLVVFPEATLCKDSVIAV